MSLRSIAGDASTAYAALASTTASTVEARHGATVAWHADVAGTVGPIAVTSKLVGATAALREGMRGEPGSRISAFDATTGKPAWSLDVDATEWAVITSIAAAGDDFVIGGTFSGTLRIGARVVSSAGKADGFVARIAATGQIGWLVRVGGPGEDAVQGVAARGDRIAIAGTFMTGADVLGQPLETYEDKLETDAKKRHELPYSDAFAATFDGDGHRVWAQSFGGSEDDTVAGVAIDDAGRVIVAATVRGSLLVNNATLVAKGPADGLVAWWSRDGTPGSAVLLGGLDFDGLRAIVAVDQRVVVGGFFSGALPIGGRTLSAGGGDDAFVAALDDGGKVVALWQAGGDGREEITALAAIPGGFVAGVSHTAGASISGVAVPAPSDPMTGAVIVVRPLP